MGRDLHLSDGTATAAAVVLHPHPAMGGDRHHPLVVAVAEGLARIGIAALRVDLTDPDPGPSATVLEQLSAELLEQTGTERLVLVGYSWGSVVSLLAQPPQLVARALVAPPASMLTSPVPEDGTPMLVQVPAHDQYGPPETAHEAFGGRPGTEIEVVEGCDHFLAGAVARIAERTVAWVGAQLGGPLGARST
jgi:alpha/beta superfamily hydrolase